MPRVHITNIHTFYKVGITSCDSKSKLTKVYLPYAYDESEICIFFLSEEFDKEHLSTVKKEIEKVVGGDNIDGASYIPNLSDEIFTGKFEITKDDHEPVMTEMIKYMKNVIESLVEESDDEDEESDNESEGEEYETKEDEESEEEEEENEVELEEEGWIEAEEEDDVAEALGLKKKDYTEYESEDIHRKKRKYSEM